MYKQLPDVYVRNCAIYASRVSVLEEQSMIGEKCRAYMMPVEFSIDINEMFHFEMAEYISLKDIAL